MFSHPGLNTFHPNPLIAITVGLSLHRIRFTRCFMDPTRRLDLNWCSRDYEVQLLNNMSVFVKLPDLPLEWKNRFRTV